MSAAVVVAAAAGVCAALASAAAVTAVRTRPRRPSRVRRREHDWLARLARVGRRVAALAPSHGLDERIAAAGLGARVRATDVMAAKVGAAVVAPVVAAPLALMVAARPAAALLSAAACAGFLSPDLWLARRARVRVAAMKHELPDVVDLLRVAVAAGLPPVRALAEVGRRRRGLIGAELRAAVARAELGMPLAEAIGSLPSRCPVDGVAALVAAVERAERHGAPLASTLTAVALRARAERARAMREDAARAAPKMQLVVALLLAPAVMLAVAAALTATFLR
jgi:tight adherence protein C